MAEPSQHPGGACKEVQKEDFLRPDSGSYRGDLRKLYSSLKKIPAEDLCYFPNSALHGAAHAQGLYEFDAAVTCAGVAAGGKSEYRPNMHHKFLVFLRAADIEPVDPDTGVPDAAASASAAAPAASASASAAASESSPDDYGREAEWCYQPYAVWTGSFNMSVTAQRSLENVVYIEDKQIALAYFREWATVQMCAEELDWKHTWVAPEGRYDPGES